MTRVADFTRLGLFLGMAALWPGAAVAAAPDVETSGPLIDLVGTVQAVTADNLRLEIDLEGFPGAGDDRRDGEGAGRGRKTTVKVARIDGAWQAGQADVFRTSPDAEFTVDASKLEVGPDAIEGTLVLERPGKGEAGRTVLTLRARARPAPKDAFWPKNDIDIRTWPYYFMYPQSQGAAWEVGGTWTVEGRSGKVVGFAAPPLRPGRWNMGAAVEGGVRFDFDLGTKRQNWNYGRLAIYEFPGPRDLSAFDGLRLEVAPVRPRRDVEVTVWLREADGSWYHVESAVPLVNTVNRGVALFEDFADAGVTAPVWSIDEDHRFDPSAVSHLAVGILWPGSARTVPRRGRPASTDDASPRSAENPFGVGKVPLALKAVDLVKVADPDAPAMVGPARVAVTGKTLSINGHDVVPVGLFGGYWDLPPNVRAGCFRHFSGGPTIPKPGAPEKFHIDVWYDRYGSALQLTQPDWRDGLARRAREYARKAKEAGYQAHIEFWNEPYLNWARTRKNFRTDFFRREGDDVIAKATGQKVPFFTWEDGKVVDSSQHTYYSARGNSALYDEMLLVLARNIKEVYPDVQVIVSWGFRWKADHWMGWELQYKPSIDRCMPYIDGASEHHYGGEPTALIGMYEVLAAYGRTQYGKWLYSYNTETGDLTRVPVHGRIDTPKKAKNLTEYRKAIYEVRDILSCASQAPDKVRSRTILTWKSQAPHAAPVAYGFLKDLRGRLVEAQSDDEKVWCVASIDGTDPDAPRPGGGHALVVAIFNDHPEPRAVRVEIAAPAGTTFDGGTLERVPVDRETFEFDLERRPVEASGTTCTFDVTLPRRDAWKVALRLKADPPPRAFSREAESQVVRRQFFSPDILREVVPGEPFETSVALDGDCLKRARRAWLRLVLEDVAVGEGSVRVGGQKVPLPKAYTPPNVNRTVELPVDLGSLSPDTPVTFRVSHGDFAGYRVDVTSIVLETVAAERAP